MRTLHAAPASKLSLGLMALAGLVAWAAFAPPVLAQHHPAPSPAQAPAMRMDHMSGDEMEVAHPFYTHMGMPEGLGVYTLRLGALISRAQGISDADLAIHVETGLTRAIGVHVRNDGIVNTQHTEVMFQYAAVRSRNGMSGIAPILEFELPTHTGGDQHINTLVGFSTALAGPRGAFNQVVHYDPRTKVVEGSAAFVAKVGTRWFPVAELSGEDMPDESPIINVLGGMKVRMTRSVLLGLALQAPVTTHKDYSWQLIFQSEIEWGKMR